MLVLLLALVTPSWAQNLCSVLNISCKAAGESCDSYRSTTLLVNHTFAGCANNLVCAGRNWTCRTKPMVGTPCEDDEDCEYRGQMEELYCNKAGSTHMCAVPAEINAPTDGCRANGDVCTMDSQCAWGACVSGWCQGLLAGANCSGGNAAGCGWNLFCWQNTTDMNHNMCAMKKATGQPAVEHSWGWEYSCMTGFVRNDTGVPTCVSYDGWWGTRTAGQQCYYEDLNDLSHELCVNGHYCAEENSTCTMDRADKPNCTVNGIDCFDKERLSNIGTCHCTTNNANPTCAHSNCGNAGARWAAGFAAAARCGATPQQNQGRCVSAPNYDEKWNGSCTFRAEVCNPGKSYLECEGNFQVDQWKRVLFPTGKVCGMDINPGAMFWPSYCSSATLTQPLLVLVVGLMALLRL